jgi:hypothetical protein
MRSTEGRCEDFASLAATTQPDAPARNAISRRDKMFKAKLTSNDNEVIL